MKQDEIKNSPNAQPRQSMHVILGAAAIILGIACFGAYAQGYRAGRSASPKSTENSTSGSSTSCPSCPMCPKKPLHTLPAEYEQFFYFSLYLDRYQRVPTRMQLDTFRKTSPEEVTQARLEKLHEYFARVEQGTKQHFGSVFDWGHRSLMRCNGEKGFFGTKAAKENRPKTDYSQRQTTERVNSCIAPS